MLSIGAILTSPRRRNDEPITIGLAFGRLWATPVGWEAINAAGWKTSRAMTTLKERKGHDPFHGYDGTCATGKDLAAPLATTTGVAAPAPALCLRWVYRASFSFLFFFWFSLEKGGHIC